MVVTCENAVSASVISQSVLLVSHEIVGLQAVLQPQSAVPATVSALGEYRYSGYR